MSEIQVNTPGANSSQVVFHNPGQIPLQAGAGQPIVVAAKPAGQPNGKILGQVQGTSIVANNPA